MTYFLSLVTDSNFFPSLSGGAVSSGVGDDAFAGLLGTTQLDSSLWNDTAMAQGLAAQTVTGTARTQTDCDKQPNCVKLPAVDKLVFAEQPAGKNADDKIPQGLATQGLVTPDTVAEDTVAQESDGGTIALELNASPAQNSEAVTEPSERKALKPNASERGLEPSVTPSKNGAANALLETTSAFEGKPRPEQKPEADSVQLPDDLGDPRKPERGETGKLPEKAALGNDKPAEISAAMLQPAVVPAEGLKPSQPQAGDNDSDRDESSEEPVQAAAVRKPKDLPNAAAERVAPRAASAPPQPANDVAKPDFASRIASDVADGTTQPAVAAAGPAGDHGAAKAAEVARMAPQMPTTEAMVSARPGQIGRELGVQIAKHSKDGHDGLTIRLDPGELGRIHVRMHFDDHGSLRAHVSADSNAALDMLRRDSQDLARALGDAGVRTDVQSFRFDGRGHEGSQQQQRQAPVPHQHDGLAQNDDSVPDEPAYRRLRPNGGVDLFA